MEFEWDEAQSDACLAQHGFDFAFAAGVFADPTLLVEVDDRRDYGEPRLVTVGRIADLHFTVVFTPCKGQVADRLGPPGQSKGDRTQCQWSASR